MLHLKIQSEGGKSAEKQAVFPISVLFLLIEIGWSVNALSFMNWPYNNKELIT